MSDFNTILQSNEEQLLQIFYRYKAEMLSAVAKSMQMRSAQLICAVGFNCASQDVTEILPILDFATFAELVQERNDIFTTDIYKRLSLDNVLNIYTAIKDDADTLEVMQDLLRRRLEQIESIIEKTVNALVIDKYRSEMRAIYGKRIARIDFVEERLNRPEDGFRALLNEVSIIIDSKIIPAGDIFFRNTILPQEKRRILSMDVIPDELVKTRLEDANTSSTEKQVLHEYLELKRTS